MSTTNPVMIKPSFVKRSVLGKKLIARVCRITFGDSIYHESFPGLEIKEKEYLAPVVAIKLNGNGPTKHTFLTTDYFADVFVEDQSKLKQGSNVACFIPSNDETARKESVQGLVLRVEDPICIQWLEGLIKRGSIPIALNQLHISLDFNVSVLTALELSAGVCWFPSSKLVALDEAREPIREGFVVSDSPRKLREVLTSAYNEIQTVYHKVKEAVSDELAKCLLPVGLMVNVPVTKTITEWRQFLLSQPTCLESAYLRVQLYKHLRDAASPLFAGCGSVEKVYQECKKVLGDSDE